MLHACRGDYFDIALILDLISALYGQFRPLAGADSGSRAATEAASVAGPPTPPLANRGGGAAAAPARAGSHVQRQRHLCCQLAERAFSVVLLCLQQREAALLDTSAGPAATATASISDSDRDMLRSFLQRSATAVVRPPSRPRPSTITPPPLIPHLPRLCHCNPPCPVQDNRMSSLCTPHLGPSLPQA